MSDFELMTGIDAAYVDMRGSWVSEASLTQFDTQWREDFMRARELGICVRWSRPWPLVEASPGVYDWRVYDEQMDFADKIGLQIALVGVQFGHPAWLSEWGGGHPTLSPAHSERLAIWTEQLVKRYRPHWYIPMVEMAIDCHLRYHVGSWEPHCNSESTYRTARNNLVASFRSAASVAKEYGAKIMCNEPCTDLDIACEIACALDCAGINYYWHQYLWHEERFPGHSALIDFMRMWHKALSLPLALVEIGIPESYDPDTKACGQDEGVFPGRDENRMKAFRLLRRTLAQADQEKIPLLFAGWFPLIDNVDWGSSLTDIRPWASGDCCAVYDLQRLADGSMIRVPCTELIAALQSLKSEFRPMQDSARFTYF